MVHFYMFCFLIGLASAVGPQAPKVRPEDIPTYSPPEARILDGEGFTEWISQEVGKGSRTLALAAGSYHVNPGSQAHISFSKLASVTIWMDSVNLTMTKVGLTAFNIYECSDLITYGPTVWWDSPGFSQATITDVKNTRGNDYSIEFHLDDGYNSSYLFNMTTGQLAGEYTNPSTGRLQAGPGWSTVAGIPSPVGGQAKTYSMSLPNSYFVPLVGFKLLARGEFVFCNQVTNSNNTIINDFTLLNCAGFGFFSGANRRTTFNSFSLKPASFPPPGATELPARSSSADGIHSGGDYVGPTFDSCLFSALDDDCMAVHGSLYQMRGKGSSRNSFLVPTGEAVAGDVLRFYSNGSDDILGTATVTSASLQSAPYEITVDHLPQEVQDEIDNAYWTNQMRVGSGFNVLNTHTTGNRGRGAIIKASNGVIANNLFEGVAYSALDLGPEFSSWSEADYVHNLTLVNNTVHDCNYLSKAAAAVMLHGDGNNPMNGNTNITINGLTIANTTASNLYIGASEAVSLGNINFVDAYSINYTLWESWPGAVATFQNVSFKSVVGQRCIKGSIGKEGIKMALLSGTVDGLGEHAVKVC